jgi:5-methylcytosine-specific restriction endonuclease McrA
MENGRAPLRLIRTGTHAIASCSPDGDVVAVDTRPAPHASLERLNAVRLLSLDAHGRALDWMHWQDAACLYARGAVAWTLGDPCLQVHGGLCRATGRQSLIELHPIVAARGHARAHALDPTPSLTNVALFARDGHLCLYCGRTFPRSQLTRDHVLPLSKGGRDLWENVVAACFPCNSRKGNRTPQQAGMPLLAIPYRPSWIEHLILSNRHILADQMAFLKNQLPKNARMLA